MSNMAVIDNGTMVETFKLLKYYQLATSSHVSKRFWNLIRTHRHKLSLLDVNEIFMKFMDLKNSDERQIVEAIAGIFDDQDVESLKRTYAEFFVKDERLQHMTDQIFEFANNVIGKKF